MERVPPFLRDYRDSMVGLAPTRPPYYPIHKPTHLVGNQKTFHRPSKSLTIW